MNMKLTQKENAYRHIRNKVATGEFPAGGRLYPAQVAREIGVSLVPVREAIGQLQTEGLVVQKPRHGVFVREIERRDLVDLIEFRTTLECAAAAAAARRITAAQLKELEKRWRELSRAAKPFHVPAGSQPENLNELLQEWHLADVAFHMLLFRAAGNRRAIRAIEDTHVMIRMFGQRVDNPEAWTNTAAFAAQNLQAHKEVYDAIRRHDSKGAQRAMRLHMRRAGKNLLARFDWMERHKDVGRGPVEEFPDSMRDSVRGIQSANKARLSKRLVGEDVEEEG